MQSGLQNGRHEKSVYTNSQNFFSVLYSSKKSVVLETNRMKPRLGATYVGPDLGCSLVATVQNTDRSVSQLKLVNVNPFSAETAFMLMQTGWIQASRQGTRRLA